MSEYAIEFNVPRFLLLFLYHIMFFVLGPFSLPFIILTSSKGFAANMGFWMSPKSKNKGILIIQYNQWISHLVLMVFWTLRELDDSREWLPGIYSE